MALRPDDAKEASDVEMLPETCRRGDHRRLKRNRPSHRRGVIREGAQLVLASRDSDALEIGAQRYRALRARAALSLATDLVTGFDVSYAL